MTIRPATNSDINQISDLYHELFIEMSVLQPESYAPAQQNRTFIRNMIHSPEAAFFVACGDEGFLYGLALVEECETPDYSALIKRRYAYLMDIIVARDYRSNGIGSQLIRRAKDWAASRNLEYMELNVLAQNLFAIELYKRLGFEHAKHVMQCPIDSPRN